MRRLLARFHSFREERPFAWPSRILMSRRTGLAGLLMLACFLPLAAAAESGVDDPSQPGLAEFHQFSYRGESLEEASPEPGEFRNPILSGYYPDPSLTRVGDEFYLVNSSFTHYPGLPVFRSGDLVNWLQIGNAIDRKGPFDFNGLAVSRGIFAPDISHHDGRYYIVSTCVDCGGNFVITAENPAGPWSDPSWLGFEGIDPSIYWEGESAFIVNNGAPEEPPRYEGHRAIWIQAFDWKNLKMTGRRSVLINGGVDISRNPIWIEGPHVFNKDGVYYLTAAEGGTGDQHSQTIFRSEKLWGPYTPADHNPILTQRDLDPGRPDPVTSAGHAKFVELPNGDWWATFLATRPYGPDEYNIGRETFLLPVTWADGWPVILPPGAPIPYTLPRPALPEDSRSMPSLSGDFSYVESFDGDRLGPEWVGIRTPVEPIYRLQDGTLTLTCKGGFGDLSIPPPFIGRRQQHHVATVSVIFSFEPVITGQRAGLAAVQNDTSLMFFGMERFDDGNRLVVSIRDGTLEDTLVAETPLPDIQEMTLTMKARGGAMDFEYTLAGQRRTLAADVDARLLSTRRAGGFVGTIIGPYCESPQPLAGPQ